MPDTVVSERNLPKVFISYSRRDGDFVRKLADVLSARNRNSWVDWKDIPPTAEWHREILRNIEQATDFLIVISPDSLSSANCQTEIEYAAENHKRMFPILHRAVAPDTIPESLSKVQWIDFSGGDFDERVAALIEALDTNLEWTQFHTRLLTRAREWERRGKERSFLLRGKDLNEAEQWIAKSANLEPKAKNIQSEYVLASRQSVTRQLRITIGAVTVGFFIAIALAVYAFIQTAKARASQSVYFEVIRRNRPGTETAYCCQSCAYYLAMGSFCSP